MNSARVRSPRSFRAALTLGLLALLAAPSTAAEPTGIWKLVVLAFGNDEFAIVDLHRQDGQPRGVLVDGHPQLLKNAKVQDVELGDGRAAFELKGTAMTVRFTGAATDKGPYAGGLVGTAFIQGENHPAALVKTREERLAPPQPNPFIQDFLKAAREDDLGKKVDQLRALIAKNPGTPSNQIAYTELLKIAEPAKLPASEVERIVAAWRRDAEPFGRNWSDAVALKAFKALAPGKPFAETALKLGRELESSLPADASTEAKASLANLLATAARNAGKPDVAADAESRAAKLDAQLDAEYHEKVPPFKPTPYKGRKPGDGRTVLFELFTGAQCPPCVAADVAFDALLTSYEPADVIGLQYHLHIPRPDPLTNPDSLARQKYYGDDVRGTPSTFLNGKPEAPGGGPMALSEPKYDEFRGLIDEALKQPRAIDLDLKADRDGDQIVIKASAKQAGAKAGKSDLKLRLAITEGSVRYVGTNGLRFHHHVVRSMPGGPEGVAVADGKGEVEVKVDLAQLREKLGSYVSDFAKEEPFPTPAPEIALKDLHVVAFVQDDADKSILGASSVQLSQDAR